ncbi:hypothetical protein AAHE18_18G212300 [Arachis hypogaea]
MAAEDDKNLVEISENTIDIARYMNYVSAPQAGAIATFAGTTRDTFESKTVLELRADALEACRFIIDEVKATVPIWKKEVYSNGEVWKENSEFLERRSDLGNKDVDCSAKMAESMERSNKKPCCGTKVKVDDDVSQK